MALYLPVSNVKNSMAIAICSRCQRKMYYGDLLKDPNNGLLVCKDDVDAYDPWRLPARTTENIALQHPRPDVSIATAVGTTWDGGQTAWDDGFTLWDS